MLVILHSRNGGDGGRAPAIDRPRFKHPDPCRMHPIDVSGHVRMEMVVHHIAVNPFDADRDANLIQVEIADQFPQQPNADALAGLTIDSGKVFRLNLS